MQDYFEQHGAYADVKASRPENQSSHSNSHVQTKISRPPNKKEGRENEPSHSGQRG
jgi:hypothetical protein